MKHKHQTQMAKTTYWVNLAECGLAVGERSVPRVVLGEKKVGLTSLAEMFSHQTLPHHNS